MRLITSLALIAASTFALAAPKSADELMKEARAKATKSNKNVLVIFHASWCGWCKKFDKFLDTTDAGKLVKSGLEVVHVTVMETPGMKADENPGGMELLKSLNGDKAGLPFMAIIDAKTGKPLVNSLQNPEKQNTNTGYPAAPEEIAHFIKMLEVGAPTVSSGNRTKIEAWLKANAPKS
jgi:thiol-disulfide isomerase/thioredoxin